VPKFSESHPLYFQAISKLMIVAFVWLYAWALGEFILEPTFDDLKIKYMKNPIFSFQSNEICVLDQFPPIIFLSNTYDRPTRIVCLFLGNPYRVVWLVCFAKKLLSLTWSGMGLGSCHVTSYYTCVTLSLWLLFPVRACSVNPTPMWIDLDWEKFWLV
jgi:hypothetical protein